MEINMYLLDKRPLLITCLFAIVCLSLSAQSLESLVSEFDERIKTYEVDGSYNYQVMTSEKKAIARLVENIGTYPEESNDDNLQFGVLAYNTIVINQILNAYPIQSVKQVPDFFTRKTLVAGKILSLNELEKQILSQVNHPVIHFLLVCGAKDCPSPPDIKEINTNQEWLDQVYQSYLVNPKFVYINPFKETTQLSAIFNWYEEDFGGEEQILMDINLANQTNISGDKISYDPYDWALNDVRNDLMGQRFIPTRLLTQGQVEVKLFSNYYTQVDQLANDTEARSSFFSELINITFGSNKNINIGLFARLRSVTVNPNRGLRNYFSAIHTLNTPFANINGVSSYQRFGLSALGPQIRYRPKFNNNGNNVFLHTITFPIGKVLEGNNSNGYLDWQGISLFNQWYLDYDIKSNRNIFFDIGFNLENIDGRLFRGEGGYTLISTPVTAIYSIFPGGGWTLYGLGNLAPRIALQRFSNLNVVFDPFAQLGGGIKKFISDTVELELLVTKFWGGNIQRRASTVNFGIRYTY